MIYLAVNRGTLIPQGPTRVPVACELVLARGSEGQERRRADPALLTRACAAPPASVWAGYHSHDHLFDKHYPILCDMAPRTNERVVFDTTESHRVVRDHVGQINSPPQ